MQTTFTLAVVQFAITHLQPEENLRRVEHFIQKAVAAKAHVIVFPEDFMTGSIFGDTTYLDREGKLRSYFVQLAKQYAIDIVTGSWMEQTAKGAFNSSSYIDSSGNILGTYSKNHLYLSEAHFLKPGTDIAVFDTQYGKAGIIICWDIMFPEIFQRMVEQGVHIVYCPSYWYKEIAGEGLTHNPNAEEQHLDALCLTRAVENTIVFVYANAAGTMTFPNGTSNHLVGHSQIALPISGTIAKLDHNREDMIVQTVDMSFLDMAQRQYSLRTTHP